MFKNLIFGVVLPLLFVATGIGVFIGMKRPLPGKKPPVADNRGALLGQMLAADVQPVRALAELSDTLDLPVNGTVVPYREIELAAEAAGKITEKNPNVRSGNFVQQGEVLFRVDPRDYELEVDRLVRKLDQERASLVEQQQEITNVQRLLEVADQELALADEELRRMQSLGENFRSATELDQVKRSRLASMNQRVGMQNQLSLLQARRSRLELATKLAETELEQARLNLSRTVIRAPVDGRIVSEEVETDSYVQRGTPLVVIEDTEQVEVACNVRMDQLYWILDRQQLSADQLVNAAQASRYDLPQLPVRVQFTVAGRESLSYEWRGRLDRYDGAGLDPQSRTVPLRVLVPQPREFFINGQPARESNRSGPSALVRGMFVKVLIETQPTTPLLLVPKLSVKPATGSNQIWKFRPDELALREKRAALEAAGNLAQGELPTSERPHDVVLPIEKPDDWQPGFLTVVEGVEVIGPFEPQRHSAEARSDLPPGQRPVEYLVCEVPAGSLAAGDAVVVTPLPGIEADGDETIRVRKSQLP